MKYRIFDKVNNEYPEQGKFLLDILGILHIFDCKDNTLKNLKDPDRYVVEFSTDAFEFDESRKQGKKMFQGDVVRCDCFESHEIYIVEIDNFKKLPDEMTGSKCNSRQIIGTIHETKQL